MKSTLTFLLCLLTVSFAFAQEKTPEPQKEGPDKEIPKEQKIELKSGLKKGQEFTCVVSSDVKAPGNTNDDSSFKFDIVCKVADVTKEGAARIKGRAKGEATMQWLPAMGKSETREINNKEFEAEIIDRMREYIEKYGV